MEKVIKKIVIDGDAMSVYNLIEELNIELLKYNLSVEVEDAEHDGYDVVILSEK